ncbi:MAG: EF-hand domain-containing protein [Rhizobiaceae bacterium]|nr:EF-hand domain-containing protein [Rhizobiaceae bacterium]
MKRTLKLAIAFATLAGLAGSVASANEGPRRSHGPGGLNFERADADDSGDVTFDEFAALMNNRIDFAEGDADSDGKLTVGEIAAEMERQRHMRRAERMVERYDIDGDGSLTLDEIQTNQREVFALMDRNNDGVIEEGEIPRRERRDRRRGR